MNEYSNHTITESNLDEDSFYRRQRRGRIWTGIFILGIGIVLLLRQYHFAFPFWFFSWPVLLISIGLLKGVKESFRPGPWLVILAVGGIFLSDRLRPDLQIQNFAWPLLIMAIGFWIIFRPKSHRRHFGRWPKPPNRLSQNRSCPDDQFINTTTENSDLIDATSVFGGVKKIILSKNFKGGEITNFMGGTEINLTQADIQGPINIDATNIFGGTKLIIPSTWDVQSDIMAIFGGVDDKRMIGAQQLDSNKIVRLTGTCLFGGIEIKSF